MIYQDVRCNASTKPPHEAWPMLFDVNISKLAAKIGCHRLTLTWILSGTRQASKKLDDKITEMANQIDMERQAYWGMS
jgi:hypothetical protein